jgi:ATP-dependent helicase HrpB
VHFLIEQGEGGDYEAFSDAALLETLDIWCSSLLSGIQSLSDIPAAALDGAVKSLIPWNMVQRVDELAPTHFTAPTGAKHRIEYKAEGGPIVSLRVQECFGLKDHPKLGRKGFPLRLALLSPAHRPIQITKDLPGFWSGSYGQVRSEMRGRYPKHPWPEDPAHAEPTKRAKPRKA